MSNMTLFGKVGASIRVYLHIILSWKHPSQISKVLIFLCASVLCSHLLTYTKVSQVIVGI